MPTPAESARPFDHELVVHITHRARTLDDRVERSDPRTNFWRFFLADRRRLRDDAPELSVDRLESNLIRTFGPVLKRFLESMTRPAVVTADSQRKAALAAAIVVNARVIRYSSLDLGLTFQPIKNVVELFDGNFDYFAAFLSAYIPQAFASAIGQSTIYPGDWEEIVAGVDFAYTNLPLWNMPFDDSASTANVEVRQRPMADKARWSWILANTSLVVPTILAAGYLYGVNAELANRGRAIDDQYRDLIRAQRELIKTLSPESREAVNSSAAATTPVLDQPTASAAAMPAREPPATAKH